MAGCSRRHQLTEESLRGLVGRGEVATTMADAPALERRGLDTQNDLRHVKRPRTYLERQPRRSVMHGDEPRRRPTRGAAHQRRARLEATIHDETAGVERHLDAGEEDNDLASLQRDTACHHGRGGRWTGHHRRTRRCGERSAVAHHPPLARRPHPSRRGIRPGSGRGRDVNRVRSADPSESATDEGCGRDHPGQPGAADVDLDGGALPHLRRHEGQRDAVSEHG